MMLTHAKIVVGGTGNAVLLRCVLAPANGLGELTTHALKVSEDALASLFLDLIAGGLGCGAVVGRASDPQPYDWARLKRGA